MATRRGAVWEGWGVFVDEEIKVGPEERKGAIISSSIDGEDTWKSKEDEEAKTRRREMEELIDEECGDMSDEVEE